METELKVRAGNRHIVEEREQAGMEKCTYKYTEQYIFIYELLVLEE